MNKFPKTICRVFTIFTFIFVNILNFATPVFADTFSDVKSGQIYHDGIEFLATNGIVKGFGDGTYAPAKTLSRADLLKIIAEGVVKYSGQSSNIFDPYIGNKCFNDVPSNQWYTKYVCYAKANNWVIGYDNGKTFQPDLKVKFVEAAKMTFKGFGLVYDETTTPWYMDLVTQASLGNYIPYDVTGFSNEFRRDQMADMITRILKAKESPKAFADYLGDRLDIVVSYETLNQSLDLSKLQVETQNRQWQ